LDVNRIISGLDAMTHFTRYDNKIGLLIASLQTIALQ